MTTPTPINALVAALRNLDDESRNALAVEANQLVEGARDFRFRQLYAALRDLIEAEGDRRMGEAVDHIAQGTEPRDVEWIDPNEAPDDTGPVE